MPNSSLRASGHSRPAWPTCSRTEAGVACLGIRIWFAGGTVVRPAWFSNARFEGWASFEWARFEGDGWFSGADFQIDARFRHAQFLGTESLGPMMARNRVLFDWALFDQSVAIEVVAQRLSCYRASFEGDVDLRVRYAAVDLTDASLSGMATVRGSSAKFSSRVPARGKKATIVRKLDEAPADSRGDPAPRLLSLRGVSADHVVLSGVDLSYCRFAEAQRLDQLRLQGACRFAGPPRGLRVAWRWPPIWWWTRRQTLAEEHAWRADPRHGPVKSEGWTPPADGGKPLRADQIAVLYRELRKAIEDVKDEPGAADFYYGEMEMRRRHDPADARRASWSERCVVWLYWSISGYGLRASRALLALAVVIGLGAVCLGLFGLKAGQHPNGGVILFALESSIGLLRAPDTAGLTVGGHVVQIALRLAGPLFFGLALLGLRGRVKR